MPVFLFRVTVVPVQLVVAPPLTTCLHLPRMCRYSMGIIPKMTFALCEKKQPCLDYQPILLSQEPQVCSLNFLFFSGARHDFVLKQHTLQPCGYGFIPTVQHLEQVSSYYSHKPTDALSVNLVDRNCAEA